MEIILITCFVKNIVKKGLNVNTMLINMNASGVGSESVFQAGHDSTGNVQNLLTELLNSIIPHQLHTQPC